MKRKNWVSIVCGGILLLAVASPVTAAGWDLVQPRQAMLEVVMEWLGGWLPASEVESRVAAGKKTNGPADENLPTSCDGCIEGQDSGSYGDPDG